MEYVKKNIDWIKENKAYDIILLITLILSYGFYATHYTFHIDQLVSDYYNGTTLIGAGRWAAPLIHWLTNWMNFAPFWHTAVMAILLFFSATAWVILFRDVSNGHLTVFASIGFSVFFVSFPVLEAQLTYPVLNIALSYLLVPVSLWFVEKGIISKKNGWKNCFISMVFLIPAIDMYESFAAVFLVGLFSVLSLHYLYDEDFSKKLKDVVIYVLKGIIVLVAAIGIDFLISKLMCLLFCGTTHFWYGNNTRILWFLTEYGVIDNAIWLFRNLIAKYLIGAIGTPFLLLFLILAIVGFIGSVIFSIKKRSPIAIFCYAGLLGSCFSLSLIIGSVIAFSQEQTMPIFVAVIVMIILLTPKKNVLQLSLFVLLSVIAFNQTKTINNYAVANYERFHYETELLEEVGTALLERNSKNKVVVFNADNYETPASFDFCRDELHPVERYFQLICCNIFDKLIPEKYLSSMGNWFQTEIKQTNDLSSFISNSLAGYESFIAWACPRSDSDAPYSANIYDAMNRLGYHFDPCTKQDLLISKNLLIDNNPAERFEIIENEDMIVVQFMSTER